MPKFSLAFLGNRLFQKESSMKQCVKIHIEGKTLGPDYRFFVQKKAVALGIEGTIRSDDKNVIVIHASGPSEQLDDLIDQLYKGTKESHVENITVEPFVSEVDFRGVFRIIGD